MYLVDRLKHYLGCERGFLGTAAVLGGGALLGALSSGDQKSSANLDPRTQAFVNGQLRPGAISAAQQLRQMEQFGPQSFMGFMDPFQQQVIDQLNMNFDRSRDQAIGQGLSQATQAGAGRSTRGGVLQAQLAGQVERARGGAVANQLSQGFTQANQLAALQQRLRQQGILAPLQALQAGVGPGTFGQTQTQHGAPLGQRIAGGALGGAQIAGGLGFQPFGGGGIPSRPTPVAPGAVQPPRFG